MIGSIPDTAFDQPLGALLEDACPVCLGRVDRDNLYSDKRPLGTAVVCEDELHAESESTVHRHCAVPMRDGWLVTDPIDARLWKCTACVLRAQKVLESEDRGYAQVAAASVDGSGLAGGGLPLRASPSPERQKVSDGPARDNGEAAHAGATRAPGHYINSHHLQQALVAKALARDLREDRI